MTTTAEEQLKVDPEGVGELTGDLSSLSPTDDDEYDLFKNSWSKSATKLLLDTYLGIRNQSDGKPSKAIWKRVAESLEKQGYNFSEEQCSQKLRNLKVRYRAYLQLGAEDSLNKPRQGGGRPRREPPCFSLLREIFGLHVPGSVEEEDPLAIEVDETINTPTRKKQPVIIKVDKSLAKTMQEDPSLAMQIIEAAGKLTNEVDSKIGTEQVWSNSSIRELLQAYINFQQLLQDGTKKPPSWKRVATHLAKKGYNFTEDQCSHKFRNLKVSYKNFQVPHKRGNLKKEPPCLELLEQLFGHEVIWTQEMESPSPVLLPENTQPKLQDCPASLMVDGKPFVIAVDGKLVHSLKSDPSLTLKILQAAGKLPSEAVDTSIPVNVVGEDVTVPSDTGVHSDEMCQWDARATRIFLEEYRLAQQMPTDKSQKNLWKLMVTNLAKHGFQFSEAQVLQKFRNLKVLYKSYLKAQRTGTPFRRKMPFLDQLKQIFCAQAKADVASSSDACLEESSVNAEEVIGHTMEVGTSEESREDSGIWISGVTSLAQKRSSQESPRTLASKKLPVETLIDRLEAWRREDREWDEKSLRELTSTIERIASERNAILNNLVQALTKTKPNDAEPSE